MLLVREIMYCKPGKVRPLLEKFRAMAKLGEKKGWAKMRMMTDVCAERYWTLVAEMEVQTVDEFMKMMEDDSADMEEMGKIMEGYHDLVDYGKREIYKIEE
jgi:hypothetical protein